MGFGGPFFVIALVAICMGSWLINNWIRTKHGYAPSDDWGRTLKPTDRHDAARLADENAQLHDQIGRLEARLQVLERIATDQPERLSAEIERLRDPAH